MPFILYRGYTNHEHLDEFALINMNARLYDPVIGRVLSPDNLIVLIDNSQNYNRYTYCFNNPLKYSDPTGNWGGWDDLAAITIGASVNVYTHWDKITQSGSIDWVALGEAAVIGGVAGEVALLTGGAAVSYLAGAGVIAGTGGVMGGAIIGVVGGATGSMVKQIGNNQVFGDPISGKEVLRDAAIGGVVGGLIGGGVALYKGQNVWWGTPKVPTTLQIKPEESVKPNPAAEANAGGKVTAGKAKVTQFGDNPKIDFTDPRALKNIAPGGHSYSNGRLDYLGGQAKVQSNVIDFTDSNLSLMREGSNGFQGVINGRETTILVDVTNNSVRSITVYSGFSNRVPTTLINFGTLNW
jgi:RHS repeat-associated protein